MMLERLSLQSVPLISELTFSIIATSSSLRKIPCVGYLEDPFEENAISELFDSLLY